MASQRTHSANSSLVVSIARHDDPHVPLVDTFCRQAGLEHRSIALGLATRNYALHSNETALGMTYDGYTYTAESVGGAFIINLPFAVDQPPVIAGTNSSFAQREWSAFIKSMMRQWHSADPEKWFIAPGAEGLQDSKLYLLDVARLTMKHLKVPPTSCGTSIKPNAHGRPVVAKAINMWQEVSAGQYFNTTLLSEAHSVRAIKDGLNTPAIVQEFMPHNRELRVYYSHGKFTAIEIAEESDRPPIDFRLIRKSPRPTVSKTVVPEEVKEDVHHLADLLMLEYLVCDIAQIPERGGYYLFDVNPIGSWQYFHSEFGLDITEDVICGFIGSEIYE